MGQRTVLHQQHLDAGARMVDFAGWDMPIHYGSQLAEHRQVRTGAGVFDVSHMTVVDITGRDATPFLRYLLANDVAKLQVPGQALYSAMLNVTGGVLDDLIVYRTDFAAAPVASTGADQAAALTASASADQAAATAASASADQAAAAEHAEQTSRHYHPHAASPGPHQLPAWWSTAPPDGKF